MKKSREPRRSALPPDRRAAPAVWTEPPPHPTARADEAHVWLLEIPRLASLRPRLPALLEADELARGARFRFDEDRDRFELCRAAARIVLGRYVARAPASLRFGLGPHGKPHLLARAHPRLEFNIAHSGGLGILAVAGRKVGIDVERIDADRSGEDVARRFFSADEVERLQSLSPEERVEAFFSCWTRKEAYLKARGDGLALPLASFSVEFGPNAAPALKYSELGPGEVARWALFELPPIAGHASALVVEGHPVRLSCWRPSVLVLGE